MADAVGVFVVVVVELRADYDLAEGEGLRLVVAHDGDLDLPAVDALLGEQAAVEAGGELYRRHELLGSLDLADPDG